MLRKTVFWIHLSCGVAAGLVILLMSVTGVLLTYERQILAWADGGLAAEPHADAEPLTTDALLAAVRSQDPSFVPTAITFRPEPGAPISVAAGRSGSRYVDPYTGELLDARAGAEGVRAFFDAVTGWHRWFNLSGDGRQTARLVTGASNLVFLFLILSGIYLWLPRIFKWAALKTRLFFNPRATTSKARDFNWHHVFGIWSAIPLAVVVATAVVFSYGWANSLVYLSVGEQPPVRGRGGPPPEMSSPARAGSAAAPLDLDALTARAKTQVEGWQSLTLSLPAEDAATVRFSIDRGNGGQPQHRHSLLLEAGTGDVADWQPFSSQPTGQRARTMIRFLHTGEALGLLGQTVAGLVSLTSVIMVWTGLALAYRRLIAPLFKRGATGQRAGAS
jgi:uncharacterized iron-regulated membrane protein